VTLRARLFLALLALALLPTAIFALFTVATLGRATERWFRPGVDRALGSALEVTRTAVTRLEASVALEAEGWAARWPARGEAAGVRAALRQGGIDLVQLYRRDRDGWVLESQWVPEGVLAPRRPDLGAAIAGALDSGHVVRSPQGVLGGVAPLRDGRVLLAGLWVPPDFFEDVAAVGQGVAFYRRLGVVVDVQRRYVWLLLAALVAGLALLAAWLANAIAAGMTRPLGAIAGALERVAAGDLETRLEPAGAREIRSLGASFNAMRERLAAARERLREAEREATWREVARRLAHEIRNPLTPMRLSLHRLERRLQTVAESDRAAVRDSLAALLAEVEHLNRLADQFARYARLPEPQIESFDLAEVARQVVTLHEPEAVVVEIHAPDPLPVRGDRLLLSRALHNLLLNACEASPSGARVEVRAVHEGAAAVVEVLDRGPGVPEELRERVFEPYVSSKRRGSGLGLSLVRDIAGQHGGTVVLEAREGGGTRARLALPASGTAAGGGTAA
jgi:nitrogen fixation/metabolism regulation signal transduction histidine kinase